MYGKKVFTGLLALGSLLGGCATTPPITVNYYLPQGSMELTVVRTVACDESNQPIMATNVVAKMVYSRDPAEDHAVVLRQLDGSFANTQVDFVLTEDGRLQGLNSTQTGQGSEVIKSAMALTTAVFAFDGGGYAKECQFIKTHAKDKPITLTYRYVDDFRDADHDPQFHPNWTALKPIPESAIYHAGVMAMTGPICFRTRKSEEQPTKRVAASSGARDMVYLNLREPGLATVEVAQGNPGCGPEPFWNADVPVPQIGTPFELPIPKAALFGKQSVVLLLSDSGAITTLKIGKDSGVASALGAATEVANRVVETDSEEAARLKAEADVIAQQQRLVRCATGAAPCT